MVLAHRVFIIAVAILSVIAGPSSTQRREFQPAGASNSKEPDLEYENRVTQQIVAQFLQRRLFPHQKHHSPPRLSVGEHPSDKHQSLHDILPGEESLQGGESEHVAYLRSSDQGPLYSCVYCHMNFISEEFLCKHLKKCFYKKIFSILKNDVKLKRDTEKYLDEKFEEEYDSIHTEDNRFQCNYCVSGRRLPNF